MGNKLTDIHELTPENFNIVTRRLLAFSEVPEDKIEIRDVKVGEHDNKDVTIRTLVCGKAEEGKPILVYHHGYGESGVSHFW